MRQVEAGSGVVGLDITLLRVSDDCEGSHHIFTVAQIMYLLRVLCFYTDITAGIKKRREIKWDIGRKGFILTLFAVCFLTFRCCKILHTGPLRSAEYPVQ